jgi:hypothetical protein
MGGAEKVRVNMRKKLTAHERLALLLDPTVH